MSTQGALPCPLVAVCVGKDCRRSATHADVRSAVGAVASVVEVACVDVCDSPVVVVDPFGSPVVVSKLKRGKAIRDLRSWLSVGGDRPKRLERLVVRGKSARKAVVRARRSAGSTVARRVA